MSSSTGPQPTRVDSPLAIPHLPLTFDNADADKSALELAYEFEPSWKSSSGEVDIKRFTDGITNTLTKVTKKWPGKSESENDSGALLIRAYGKGTDVLIDRERELRAHDALASLDLAPPLLARFDNGLMYRFVQGAVTTAEDLRRPAVYRAVAKRLGEWHGRLPISALTSTPKLDGEVSPKFRKHCGVDSSGNATRPYPNIWSVMQQWLEALPNDTEEEKKRNTTLDAEVQELSARFGNTPGLGGKDYIFCHCDLLCGNVIVQQPSGEGNPLEAAKNGEKGGDEERPVSFIDYEYSTPGPAAFDIANHLAEWAGLDCDHSAVPTKSQRREFLKEYVISFHFHSIPLDKDSAVEIDFKKDIDTLYDQVDTFRGLPGIYWGIWALIQAMISQIDFDYTSYAELRLSEYWGWKAEMDGSRKREGRETSVREKKWAQE